MKRHALFVGVDEYTDPTIKPLEFPSEDATELAVVFRQLLKFDRVEKLINPEHSPEVVDAVKDMTRGLGPDDLFLFFFAGHGFRVKENHVLVCKKDEFSELEDEYAGLAVGQLKKRMRGPWNRMIVLDACQNDIRKTRGVDCGVEGRDLALIHTSGDSLSDPGCQIVVTSCSEGQKALEVSDLKHGLFTSAFLSSVTKFADDRQRIDLETLRMDLGVRMGGLIKEYQLCDKQVPMFTMPPNAGSIVLFNGDDSAVSQQPMAAPHIVSASPTLVICPICGKKNRSEETFKCRECGRDNLCLRHQDETAFLCADCALKRKAEREEAQRKRRVQNNEHYGHTSIGVTEKFSVVLRGFGVNKPSVLKELQKFYRVSLSEIKRSFQSVPAIVMRSVSKDDAERCKFQLENVGADVAIGHDGFFDEMLHGTKKRKLFDNEAVYIITVSVVLLGGTYVLAKLLVWWLLK